MAGDNWSEVADAANKKLQQEAQRKAKSITQRTTSVTRRRINRRRTA